MLFVSLLAAICRLPHTRRLAYPLILPWLVLGRLWAEKCDRCERFFPKRTRLQPRDNEGMKQNNAEHEFRDANWKLVGLRLLVFARYWAKAHYGWCDGRLMPTSKTPEDVVCEVGRLLARRTKVQCRSPMWVQLKSAVKSVLWNLHQLKEGKVTRAEEPAFSSRWRTATRPGSGAPQ